MPVLCATAGVQTIQAPLGMSVCIVVHLRVSVHLLLLAKLPPADVAPPLLRVRRNSKHEKIC